MNRREWILLSGAALSMRHGLAQAQKEGSSSGPEETIDPEHLLVKDYRPKSIYNIPVTQVHKAKFPAWDSHSHPRRTPEEVADVVKIMDKVGLEKAVIVTRMYGEQFEATYKMYAKYPGRFLVECGFDFTGCSEPGFGPAAIKELERCHKVGAVGLGECTDKGMGLDHSVGTGLAERRKNQPADKVVGLHPDDPKMDPLWDKLRQLGMPVVGLHISDPYWGRLKQDQHNDGLWNAYMWRLDNRPEILSHEELIQSTERMLQKHPRTIYVCAHLINLEYDQPRLGRLLDRYSNLYVDWSARFAETCTIPRATNQFFSKYQDRVIYGTDITYSQRLFDITLRLAETLDEHIYEQDFHTNFNYHWPLSGLGLSDQVLKKFYRDNLAKAFEQAQKNAG